MYCILAILKFLSLDVLGNVCFIKIRTKYSSNTLLSLVRIFMKQTLHVIKTPRLLETLEYLI